MASVEVLGPDPPFWDKTSWIQLGYGIWVNMAFLSLGLSLEFPAIAVPQLKRDAGIVMTKNEEGMIASVLTLSSPIGCLISGIILDKCGRRLCLILCQAPIAIGWFYVALSKTAKNIIIGRVITGLGIGMAIVAPRVYIAEITLPNMRGVLGALPNMGISIGLAIQAVLGVFLKWQHLSYICGGYAVILLVCNYYLPETPYYTLMKTNIEQTKKTLRKFRSAKYNVDNELDTMEDFKFVNNIRSLTICGTIKTMFRPSSCKPFAISLFYIILAQCTGIMVVTTWAVEIMKLCHSSVNPKLGNVILAVIRIFVGLFTSFLLYKVGRRPMALVSAIGVSAAALGLGGYLYSSSVEVARVYPFLFLIVYIAFAVPGYIILPPLMMFELLPLQVRGILSGLVLSAAHLTMFGTIQVFPIMRDGIGLNNTFITYGCISLLGAIILYIILPETQDLTLQEIEEYFNRRRPTLFSERRLMSVQLQHHPSFQGNANTSREFRKSKSHIDLDKSHEPGSKKRRSTLTSIPDVKNHHRESTIRKVDERIDGNDAKNDKDAPQSSKQGI